MTVNQSITAYINVHKKVTRELANLVCRKLE